MDPCLLFTIWVWKKNRHIGYMEDLLEKQAIFCFRYVTSDDPEAKNEKQMRNADSGIIVGSRSKRGHGGFVP